MLGQRRRRWTNIGPTLGVVDRIALLANVDYLWGLCLDYDRSAGSVLPIIIKKTFDF